MPTFQVVCLKHFTLAASHLLAFSTLPFQPSIYCFPVVHQYSLPQFNFKAEEEEQGVVLAMNVGQEGWEVQWSNAVNRL